MNRIGENNGNVKLEVHEVGMIRLMRTSGFSFADIHSVFPFVCERHIRRVAQGKRWTFEEKPWKYNRGNSKLDAAKVREIRGRYGKETITALAAAFNVSKAAVSAIVNGKSWKHVSMP